jgi:hypothetical protein
MQQRRRFKQILTLQDRLAAWSGKVREQADALPPTDRQRDELLKNTSGRYRIPSGRLGELGGIETTEVRLPQLAATFMQTSPHNLRELHIGAAFAQP